MSIFRSTTATTRRLGVFLALATVVAVSLGIYYFRIVPNNEGKLHRQGFLILRQDADGMCQTVEDLKYFFKNQWKTAKNKILDTNFKKRSSVNYEVTEKKDKRHKKAGNESDDPDVYLNLDGKKNASFQFENSLGSIRYSVSLDHIAKKILNTAAPDLDFFTSYFIICQKHAHDEHHDHPSADDKKEKDVDSDQHIFYHSDGLPVSFKMQSDTLGKMLRSIQFSKILNLEVSGEKFRAYLLPFQLEGHSLVLAGLISEKEYRKRLQDIPFNTVSGILIAVLLLLISFPFVKIFLLSPTEHYGIRDLLFLGLSMFLGTALLLIMLQCILMQWGAQKRIKDELQSLSADVHDKFQNELRHSYAELKHIDLELKEKLEPISSKERNIGDDGQGKQETSRQVKFVAATDSTHLESNRQIANEENQATKPENKNTESLVVQLNRPIWRRYRNVRDSYTISLSDDQYRSYSMLHWSDDSGRQIVKGGLDNQPVTFGDVNRRQYFKNIKNGHLYSFPGTNQETNSFSIEPVYSMSTNVFEVNISVPSCLHKNGRMVAAMSRQMTSVMNTQFPNGYGFYIVNDAGKILFQSDGKVTLKENFVDRIDEQEMLVDALRNRQSAFLDIPNINHQSYKILVTPVSYLPWHLVVYHNNNYTYKSVLHVASFTFLFMLMLVSVLLSYCLLAWKSVNGYSRLRQRINQYEWLKPGADKSTFLGAANLYLFLFLVYASVLGFKVNNSSLLLAMGMLFPLFAIYTLFLLFRQHVLHKRPFGWVTDSHNLGALFFLLFINYSYSQVDGGKSVHLLFRYEGIAVVLSGAVIGLFPRLINNSRDVDQRTLKLSYSSFWFLTVISTCLFPVQSFFRYAQQSEIALEIKTRQLDFAQSLEERLLKFDWLDAISKARGISVQDRKSFLFHQGVYPVNDHVKAIDTSVENQERGQRVAYLYEELIKNMKWDCTLIDEVSEQDRAADHKWWRCDCPKSGPTQMTLMYQLNPESYNPDSIGHVNTLAIGSLVPDIASYYRMDKSYLVILLFSSGLLVIFFQLIRSTVARLFLEPLVHTKTIGKQGDNFLNNILMNPGYRLHQEIGKVLAENEVNEPSDYESLKKVWGNEYDFENKNRGEIETLERRIIFNQQHLSELYEKIWKSCSDQEKYFLYDIAKDGFMNYKNTMPLQQLISKEILVNHMGYGVRIMSVSFRNYILEKEKDAEITNLTNRFRAEGAWSKIRTPALIAISAVGIFLFITQQDLLQQVATLIPTLSGLLGLGSLILGSKSSSANPK
jgi:hypothetical protein